MKLLHFRTASATEVSGYLVRMCSFSLHFGHLEEIIHVRLETNFDSTQICFYCSPPFRTTLKAIAVLCSLGHCAHCAQHIVLSDWKLWMHRLGRKKSPHQGRWTCLYPLEWVICSTSTVASPQITGGCSGSLSELVRMQMGDFTSQMNNTLWQTQPLCNPADRLMVPTGNRKIILFLSSASFPL